MNSATKLGLHIIEANILNSEGNLCNGGLIIWIICYQATINCRQEANMCEMTHRAKRTIFFLN